MFCNSVFTIIYSAQLDNNVLKNPISGEMQQRQAEFDALYFDREYFKNDQNFEKLRHVLLHVIETVGKVSSYCEMQEHGKSGNRDELVNELLPDLYLHALQIANLFDVDLAVKYQERLNFLEELNKNNH